MAGGLLDVDFCLIKPNRHGVTAEAAFEALHRVWSRPDLAVYQAETS